MAYPNFENYLFKKQMKENLYLLKRLLGQIQFNHLKQFLNYLFNFLSIPLTDPERRKSMLDKYEKEEKDYKDSTKTISEEKDYKDSTETISKVLKMFEEQMKRLESVEKENHELKEVIAELITESQKQNAKIKELNADNERLREKYKEAKQENTVLKLMGTKGDSLSEDEKSASFSLKINAECNIKAELKFNEEDTLSSPKHNAYGGFWDTLFYNYNCRVVPRNEEFLKDAAAKGNVEQVSRILSGGKIDINGRGMPDSLCSIFSGVHDKTPLMLACENGHLETVKLLLRSNANVFLKDRNGLTAMDYAVKNDHLRICNLLKLKGSQEHLKTPIMSPRMERKSLPNAAI